MRTTPLQPWIAARIGCPGPCPDRRDLQRHQLARLRDTVQLARSRAPFYRALLAGLPSVPRTLDDLADYPFTTPADVTGQGLRLLCVGQDDVARVVSQEHLADLPLAPLDTSGTTGPPKRLWFTAADQELTIDFFAVGMSTFTEPGDRALILLPCERPGSVGDLLATAMERLGATPIRHSVVRDVGQSLAAIHTTGADVAVGVPVQVLALARADDDLHLTAVLLSTDHVPRSLARAVETAWGCRVFNHYGMTEMGLGGGVECEARRGYHLREADLYVEIVDPATGTPVPDGCPGEIVFTTLTRTGMPLIRYRTGDLSRFLPGPCPCGTMLRTLERITRGGAGIVRTAAGGELALADLDEALFALPGVLDFDATLHRSPGRDRLDVEVRVAAGGAPGGRLTAQDVAGALQTLPGVAGTHEGPGVDVTVRVVPATVVAAPTKRRMRVVSANA
jgi:phenylacetate-CoA ligase